MKHLLAACLLVLVMAVPVRAYPGVGIVMDRQGNVFHTDLVHVWQIAADGRKDAEARSLDLDRLPHPLNFHDLTSALRAHYPAELAGSGVHGRVLRSLDVDASGVVTRTQAVEPPDLPPGMVITAVVTETDGQHRELTPARGAHPALKRAAEKAAQVLRFSPAKRDGEAVPFGDYRITGGLAPPEAVP